MLIPIQIYLAMEQKETDAAWKAVELISAFETAFANIRATFHPSDLPGEIAGKSSNVAWAARQIMDIHARDDQEDVTNTLVTVIDGMFKNSPYILQLCFSNEHLRSRYPSSPGLF